MTRSIKSRHKSRQAFTLVELLVVLAVLAVLAGVLIPSLLGYIRRARTMNNVEMANAYRVAAQAVADEYYGRVGMSATGMADSTTGKNIRWDNGAGKQNSADDRAWGEKILNLVGAERDSEPYILVFGIAKPNDAGVNTNEVLYVGYCATDKSMADFYYNGTWSHVYPKDAKPTAAIYNHNNKDRNYMMINGKEVQLQMIVVSNKSGKENDFWIWDAGKEVTLQGHSEKYFKG